MSLLLPQDLRIERELISLFLADNSAFKECQSKLSPEIFYHEHHAEIYSAMQAVVIDGRNISAYAVSEKLSEAGKLKTIGGDDFLLHLKDNALFSINAKELSLVLFQKYIRRKIIDGCQNSIKKSYDETIDEFDLLDDVRKNILRVHENLNKTNRRNLSDIVESYYQEVISSMNSGQKIQGIKSYIPSLDNRLGGLMKGNMITIAGRPGTGKTALLIQMIVNICLRNDKKRFIVYSIEMTGEQLVNRIVSCLMQYPYSSISKGELPVERHDEFSKWIKFIKENTCLEIVDNLSDVDEIVMDLKARYDTLPIDGAIVDYLQICKAKQIKGGNREQQVSHISGMIKTTAKELKIPFIALAQLNRETEKRNDKKPIISDLRESGSLEQDSDSVTFLYRPLYSGFIKNEDDENISDKECWLLTRKNRHGPVGEDEVWCDITCNIFMDKIELTNDYAPTKIEHNNRNYYESAKDEETPF